MSEETETKPFSSNHLSYHQTDTGSGMRDAGCSTPNLESRIIESSGPPDPRAGQSLVESCLVIGLTCLLFFGLLQISQLFAAREVLYHAAARGARAKTVGFNRWMVTKAVRVGAIPNAGRMLVPEYEREQPSELVGLVESLGYPAE